MCTSASTLRTASAWARSLSASARPIADALEAGVADGSVRSDVDRAELCSVIANALFGTMQKLVANTQGLFASKSCPAPRQMELLCDMFINYVKA